ncbi:MAG: FHA domain-containing protein [Candidatus Acidiferrum sp.]
MGILLEIKAGPFAGKKVAVLSGQTATFGRSTRAQYAFPHDTFMSGVHFAVECAASGCRAIDKKSSNGTFLNGARIKDAMLANGDEIKGGQTAFAVKIVADAKLASLLSPQEELPASASPQSSPAAEPERPASPAKVRQGEERVAAPIEAAPQPSASRRDPIAEPAVARNVAEVAAPLPKRGDVVESLPVGQAPVAGAGDPAVASGIAGREKELMGAAPEVAPKESARSGARSAVSARGFAFSVMGWSFPAAPAEWEVQEGFGLQRTGHEEFPSSVAATEEFLGGITLQQFVESQISMLRGYLRDPKIEPMMPPRVGGADESMAMDVRHATKDGKELIYRRIYARSGTSVGVLTVTTLAADFPHVLQSLKPLLDGAAFRSTVKN